MLNPLEEFLCNLERKFLFSGFTSPWKLLPAWEAEIFFITSFWLALLLTCMNQWQAPMVKGHVTYDQKSSPASARTCQAWQAPGTLSPWQIETTQGTGPGSGKGYSCWWGRSGQTCHEDGAQTASPLQTTMLLSTPAGSWSTCPQPQKSPAPNLHGSQHRPLFWKYFLYSLPLWGCENVNI